MNAFCMIESAFNNEEEVSIIVNKLLDNKLVSSCQVVKSESYWNFKHQRESARELLLLMKTQKKHVKEIYETIKSIHSYECFEFAVFDLTSVSKDYLNWIEEETTK